MAEVSIAIAQANPIVGDLSGNSELVVKMTAAAARQGALLVIFPEMMLTGYPIEDLAHDARFHSEAKIHLDHLAEDLDSLGFGGIFVALGVLSGEPEAPSNSLVVLQAGRVIGSYCKHHLPNYGVFDEIRNFVSGSQSLVLPIGDLRVAFAICEDLWQEGGPVADVKRQRADLLVVVNGSPFEQGKLRVRHELVRQRVLELKCPVAYVNLVGGQDELVFDGGSFLVDSYGRLAAQAPTFEESLLVIPVEQMRGEPTQSKSQGATVARLDDEVNGPDLFRVGPEHDLESLYRALVLATRDYVVKNGFHSVVLGLSGGIDSALTAAIAADAVGAKAIHGISMPSRFSSQHSMTDAADLAARLGCEIRTVPIDSIVRAFELLLPVSGIAAENLQARVRGMLLMAVSNLEQHLVLATSNKSEIAMGYSTLYGDAVGAFAPLKDVYKTTVWELARWRNSEAIRREEVPPIPNSSIMKEPSAELRPDQKDSDTLPTYDLLDPILEEYLHSKNATLWSTTDVSIASILAALAPAVERAEYKRRQFPPGPKVTKLSFGRERRMPITSRWPASLRPETAVEQPNDKI